MCTQFTIWASSSLGLLFTHFFQRRWLFFLKRLSDLARDNIARSVRIKDRLLKTILTWIHKERTGEVINRGLVKNITQMLIDLGVNSRTVYEDDFEKHFLETSSTFYRLESQEFISSNSAADYMKKVTHSFPSSLPYDTEPIDNLGINGNQVSDRIQEEMERVTHYLDSGTEAKIKEVVEQELIAAHMKTLIEVRTHLGSHLCCANCPSRWRARAVFLC